MTSTAEYLVHVPTFKERVLRFLGYSWRRAFFDEDPPGCPNWAKTETVICLGFFDRLRLLLTGNLLVSIEHRMDVPVREIVSVTSLRLLAPGEAKQYFARDKMTKRILQRR